MFHVQSRRKQSKHALKTFFYNVLTIEPFLNEINILPDHIKVGHHHHRLPKPITPPSLSAICQNNAAKEEWQVKISHYALRPHHLGTINITHALLAVTHM